MKSRQRSTKKLNPCGTSPRETYIRRRNNVGSVRQPATTNILVAHWANGKEGEQARSECEGRELVIKEWLSQRDEVCTQG